LDVGFLSSFFCALHPLDALSFLKLGKNSKVQKMEWRIGKIELVSPVSLLPWITLCVIHVLA
jgi:hypothetical protein